VSTNRKNKRGVARQRAVARSRLPKRQRVAACSTAATRHKGAAGACACHDARAQSMKRDLPDYRCLLACHFEIFFRAAAFCLIPMPYAARLVHAHFIRSSSSLTFHFSLIRLRHFAMSRHFIASPLFFAAISRFSFFYAIRRRFTPLSAIAELIILRYALIFLFLYYHATPFTCCLFCHYIDLFY